jgi:hypothetical protein
MSPERRPRILYYGGGWPTNIGNAFIDLGAMALLRAAVPGADVGFASELTPWLFLHGARPPRASARRWTAPLRRDGAEAGAVENALDVASVTACDLVVFAGMAMCQEFIEVNGPSVQALARRGVPVLLLGTGGLTFDVTEIAAFRSFLRTVEPVAVIARDARSIEAYRDTAPVTHAGIDCGFFVPEAFAPFPLELPPYAVLNFDGREPVHPDTPGLLQVHAHHECFDRIPPGRLRKPRTLISDLPHDYLTLYAGAEEVHSDRVHACVATLAYGRRARFYGTTPRASLFEAVGAGAVTSTLMQADAAALAEAKRRQVERVRDVVTAALAPALRGTTP